MKSQAHRSAASSKRPDETIFSSKASVEDGHSTGRTGDDQRLSLTPAHVMHMQRAIGNRAVAQMFRDRAFQTARQAVERAGDLAIVQQKSDQLIQMIKNDLLAFLKKAWGGPEGPKENWYSQIAMILKGTKFEGRAQEAYDYYLENPHLALSTNDDNDYINNDNSEKETKDTGDVSVPENRPTTGGMVEGDAAIIAETNGWEDVSGNWSCEDTSHTPKGKVYYDKSTGSYYGADNTGHVGWGFKVWTKKNKTTLSYKGNVVWDGTEWKYISRGTK